MALNWNAFLNDEQWNDPLQTSPTANLSDMQPSGTRATGLESTDLSNLDHLLIGGAAHPLYDDNFFNPNDYFLSDMEVLQPFGDVLADGGSTSESSPEPASALTGHSMNSPSQSSGSPTVGSERQMSLQPKRPQRVQTFPNPTYESMFPNSIDSGFVEDVTFPDGPTSAPNTSIQQSLEGDLETNVTSIPKRSKGKSDIISACWTSPLCPNHDQDGPPPNPSTCGSGCAPFLFADSGLPTPITNVLLPEAQEVTAEDGIVEIQPRPKKRSESQSSSVEPAGRVIPRRTSTGMSSIPQLKREPSQESRDHDHEPTPPEDEETKPTKGRRRLPHNQVERKYRESLNTQLESLRKVVPALQQNPRVCDGADIEDLPAPSKPSKAIILASATAYIKQMEKDKKRVEEENLAMKARIKQLQALVKCEDCNLMQYVMDLRIQQSK
ncbi:hypothetical protein P154DRAFT_219723 [Amniculicola lignicola CBS 123094]|uniref:BHLH domain-containing protein n=1 Tax=Amniculicola lignicola CBS 123094 TaxID=1392246 RepID=A0A6A5WXX0_9PLEO|nr:hypothetical protein P154DRAFT_219723 [Amniculicola lignicola CBS 123094]